MTRMILVMIDKPHVVGKRSAFPARVQHFDLCGILSHMASQATKATLVLNEKIVLADGAIMELVIWRLPRPTADRPHGLKYRLYFGRGGKCLVRYDNESGKGDHRHIKEREESYRFISVSRLRRDFAADIKKYGGSDETKD